MTALRSRIIETQPGSAVRARIVLDANVVELTQLHRTRDGFEAETARVFVPMEQLEAFMSALVALRAEKHSAEAQQEGRLHLRAASRSGPAPARSAPAPRHGGEF